MPSYSSYQSYGSNNQPGQSQGSSFNLPSWAANSSRARQANWGGRGLGGNNVQNMGPGNWGSQNSNWSQMAAGFMNQPGGQASSPHGAQAGGNSPWMQTGPGQWQQMSHSGTPGAMSHFYTTNQPPPGSFPTFNIPAMVGAEFQQQQNLYNQNQANALNLAGGFQGNMNQLAGQSQQMGQQQFNQGQGQAQMFQNMAQQEGPQAQQFGQESVGQMNQAAQSFRDFADAQKDKTAEFASASMVGAQQQEQNQLQQMRDRFGSMGMGPEAMAMQQQELMAMGSMGRQQMLTQIAQEDRNFQSQIQQAASQLESNAAAFSGQMDQANAQNRFNYDSMNLQRQQAYHQMAVASGQQAFNNWMATQAQSAELQAQGYGVMAQAMQQWPNSAVSFIGSLLTASNLMQNTNLGSPQFAQQMSGAPA
jgi:hypothetical protein